MAAHGPRAAGKAAYHWVLQRKFGRGHDQLGCCSRAGLRELGWIEGRTVAIEYSWADGRSERLAEIADEFVRRKVDVIVTHSARPVIAAKQATAVIPIVFANA